MQKALPITGLPFNHHVFHITGSPLQHPGYREHFPVALGTVDSFVTKALNQ